MVKNGVERGEKSVEIIPAILAEDTASYNSKLNKIGFAKRISIDLTDGEFTKPKTIGLAQAHWPEGAQADLHLMYQDPTKQLETLISLKPTLVVIHTESSGDKANFLGELKKAGIRAGVALLPKTSPAEASSLITIADHVLIFAGKLGSYGGEFDERQLPKINAIREIKSNVEICWDGGVNDTNIARLAAAGVDAVNSGGYILNSQNPKSAFDKLVKAAKVY